MKTRMADVEKGKEKTKPIQEDVREVGIVNIFALIIINTLVTKSNWILWALLMMQIFHSGIIFSIQSSV